MKVVKLFPIYLLGDEDSFLVGKVVGVNEDYMILYRIASDGTYDGYQLIDLEEIYRIGGMKAYVDRLIKIYNSDATQKTPEKFEGDLIEELLHFSKENEYIIRIEVNDGDDFGLDGLAVKVEEDCLIMQEVNDDGKDDGIAYIDIDTISSLYCDTEIGWRIKQLRELNQ